MATGFTQKVVKGELTDFVSFAHDCSRSFVYDEPIDNGNPLAQRETFDGYRTSVEQAQKELDTIMEMSGEERIAALTREFEDAMVFYEKRIEDYDRELMYVQAMAEKVKLWEPSTEGLESLKEFMLKQLEMSEPYKVRDEDKPKKLSSDEWFVIQSKKLKHRLKCHKDSYDAEVERVTSMNEWIDQLTASLEDYAKKTEEVTL